MKLCAYCGQPFDFHDERYRYCSDECALEAHRARCRENFRRRYAQKREQELERYRRYYETHAEQKKESSRRQYNAKKRGQNNETM